MATSWGGARKGAGRPQGEPSKLVRLPLPLANLAKRLADRTLRAGDINAFLDVEARTAASVPLMMSRASCGFPSPADDYIDKALDFNELLAAHTDATYAVRCVGDSMIGVGIFPGDICVIDKTLTAADGDVVLAILDGEFLIKTYRRRGDRHWLKPENPAYRDIEISEGSSFEIWGVVADSIRRLRRGR